MFTSKHKQSSKSGQLGSRLEETNSICQKAEAAAIRGEKRIKGSQISLRKVMFDYISPTLICRKKKRKKKKHFPEEPRTDIVKGTCLLQKPRAASVFKAIVVVAVRQYVCSLQISNWPWNNSTQLLIYTLWLWVCILNIQYLKHMHIHTNTQIPTRSSPCG